MPRHLRARRPEMTADTPQRHERAASYGIPTGASSSSMTAIREPFHLGAPGSKVARHLFPELAGMVGGAGGPDPIRDRTSRDPNDRKRARAPTSTPGNGDAFARSNCDQPAIPPRGDACGGHARFRDAAGQGRRREIDYIPIRSRPAPIRRSSRRRKERFTSISRTWKRLIKDRAHGASRRKRKNRVRGILSRAWSR